MAMNKVIVIGGGAAGMMAAIAAARRGARVTLLEKNEKTGKKIYITGKGRCNLTNACETEDFFSHVITSGKFLYSSVYQMNNHAVMDFFEEAGCRLKTERGERVFPVSDHSSDVINALNRQMEKYHVKVLLHTKVEEIETAENASTENQQNPGDTGAEDVYGAQKDDRRKEKGSAPGRRVTGVLLSDGKRLPADAVIVATGGLSYASTGSTGDGYRFAETLSHTVKEPVPALVPLTVKEEWCRLLQGLSLKNVSVTLLSEKKKKLYEGFGEMLFTHFGISGPLILSASSYYVKKGKKEPASLILDLKPALSTEQLDKRILRDFEENKNRQFKNSLDALLPAKLVPVIVTLSGIEPEKQVNEVTRQERESLCFLLKHLTMTITGTRGFNEAIITQGGVNVKEVNPSTMESKLVSGLYFAGEVLDLDAVTGGFNLQIAWSTGNLAGISAATGEF